MRVKLRIVGLYVLISVLLGGLWDGETLSVYFNLKRSTVSTFNASFSDFNDVFQNNFKASA